MNSALIEPLEARIAPATLTIAPASVLEGDANTTTKLIFTVTLSEASQEQVSVEFATEDGTAASPTGDVADYAIKTGMVVFAPGETSKTIEITVFGDDTGEADETMFVRLSNAQGATIGNDTATGTILNDGIHLVGPGSFLEGDATHTVTYTVLNETLAGSGPQTVHFTTIDGTATAGEDYVAASGTLNIGPNERGEFTIQIKGDTDGEEDETFQIALTDAGNVPIGAPRTITILNDGLHIVTPQAITEGDTGTKALKFKVIRETVDLGPATVKYTTVDGTATLANNDYQKAIGTLTFAQDDTEKEIVVNIVGDLAGEDNENFFVKLSDAVGTTIGQGEATGTILNDAKLSVTPVSSLEGDARLQSPGVPPGPENPIIDQKYLSFVVTLVEGFGEVTVSYSTQNGEEEGLNAVAGEDYENATGTLTFLSNETSKTVDVKIIGDLVGENDEYLLLNLTDPSPGATITTASAKGTILNDAKFSFSLRPGQAAPGQGPGIPFLEGDSDGVMDFVIQAIEAAPSGSKVNYATSNITPTTTIPVANIALAGEDYVATSGTLTFTGDISEQTVSVPIKGDYKFEADERFRMSLSTAGTSHATLPDPVDATLTTDDHLIVSGFEIIEGNSGVKKVVLTVTLRDNVPENKQYRVDYATVDGTAVDGVEDSGKAADYKKTTGTLKIAAGQRTGTIEVEVYGDFNYEEASEFFKVEFTNARVLGSGVADNSEQGAQTIDNFVAREGIVTITEGADAPPAISISDSRFLEGSGGGTKQAQFTLTLSAASDYDVQVKLSTILGTGAGAAGVDDVTPFEDRVVTIPAGQTTFTFTVDVAQDDLNENDETFSVQIKEATILLPSQSTPIQLTKTRDTAVGTIVNDEVYVTVAPVEITEGDSGTQEMVFVVQLRNSATGELVDATSNVIVNFTLEDLTALLGQDYQLASEGNTGSVTIAAGSSQGEIKVLVQGDTINEGAKHEAPNIVNKEQFKLKLTSATNAQIGNDGTNALTVTGSIADNDGILVEGQPGPADDILLPTVELEMVSGPVTEGGQAVFKVKLSHASDHAIEIPYSVLNGTAVSSSDFTAGSNLKVVIPAGQTEATITVNTLDDALIEANETFSVKLGTIGTKDAVLKPAHSGEVTATIVDNEAKPTLSIGNVVIVEGGPGAGKKAVFTVKLSAASTEAVQVNYHTIDGTAVSIGANADYTATNGTLTIAAGETEKTFEVPIIGDSTVENDETFFVRLTNPSGATIAINQATGTIATDETQFKVLFQNPDGSFSETLHVNEGDKGTTQKIKFKIVREGDLSQPSSVRFMTVGAGNEAGDLFRDATSEGARADFGYRSEVVYFGAAAAESGLYEITVNGDGHYEGTEEFVVRLVETLNGSPAEANPKMGTVQILDNEVAPTITFERSLVEVQEGNRVKLADGRIVAQQTAMTFRIKLSHVDETGTVTMRALAEALETAGLTKAMASGDKKDFELFLPEYGVEPEDRTATPTLISFKPGETEKTYTFTVLGDLRDEHDETIRVTLSNLQGGSAKFSDGTSTAPESLSAMGKIIDDDAEAVVYLSDLAKKQVDSSNNDVVDSKGNPVYIGTTYAETDSNGTDKFFLVSLEGETDKIITLKYYTENGTAEAGEDFIGVSEADAITITFNPSASNTTAPIIQKIYVPTINDDVVEGSEDFLVRLKGLTNATPGDDLRGRATVEDNDTPVLSIEDMEIVESGSTTGTLKAKFIVRLSAPAERDVVVNFTTEDGTAKAGGVFADYIAKQGSITFAKDEVVKEIEIDIIDDAFLEGHAVKNSSNQWELVHNESFKVKLSGTGVTLARATATGTILNGAEDTVIGIGIGDVQVAENQTEVVNDKAVDLPARFSVELSIPSLTNTTVNAATRSGTATMGVDFENKSGAVTINAGSTSATFAVDVINDRQFENTEHFFADLSNTPAGVQVVKSGRATIYNDDIRLVNPRTVQWIDVDGDLVTLKVSKGTLDDSNFAWLQDSSGGMYISPVGGLVLQGLDLSVGTEFHNANVTITAERQPGFNGDPNGVLGDGRVNVGFIKAGGLDPAGVSSYGVDLGTVIVDGDLSRIDAGDRYLDTPAVRKLQVFSLGVHPDLTGMVTTDNDGKITGANIESTLQGPVGTIDVRTDMSGSIRVKGGQFADIQSVKIGGALRGTGFAQSGTIIFSGTLQKAVIGEILGGTGALSGRIEGDASVVGNIGTIVVQGDLAGLSGGSGVIAASSIKKATVGRILGGAGDDSGQIRAGLLYNVTVKEDVIGWNGARSGTILTDRTAFGQKTGAGVGTVTIGGRLIGGFGINSGLLKSEGGFVGITIGGKLPTGEDSLLPLITGAVTGGEGEGSGAIQAAGEIRSLKITGADPDGNDVPVSLQGGRGSESGAISAGAIGNVQLGGAVLGGEGQASGTLYSAGGIGSLKITGVNLPDDDSANKVSLKGGAGIGSGVIEAQGTIGKATLVGDVQGGTASQTGQIIAGNINSLLIDGDLLGGGGSTSGVIDVSGTIKSLAVGNVIGGTAFATGAIAAGSIGNARILGNLEGSNESTTGLIRVAGEIKSLVISGDLKGGDSKVQNEGESVDATVDSGAITAGKIGSVRILGDVIAGENKGADLFGSGSIGVQGPIGTLEVRGSILGNADVPVKILAFGDTKAAAIGKILIGGRPGADSVEYAEITAGVSIRSTQQGYFPVNADAKIGLVRIDGDVKGLNITAGVNTGEDGKFATADDQVLSHPIAQINNPKVYSSIAQVIINGTIHAVPGEGENEILPYGIVAQHIGKVSYKANGRLVSLPLTPGAGNDLTPGREITLNGVGTGFRAIEVTTATT